MLKFAPAVLFACLKLTSASIFDILRGSVYDKTANVTLPGAPKIQSKCKIEIPRDIIYVTDSFDKVVHDNVSPYIAVRLNRCNAPFNARCGKKVPGYVHKTLRFMQKKLDDNVFREVKHDARRILCFIENNLNGDAKEFALFTASALHNTSCFRYFEEQGCNSYKSRGLLMIKGEANYSKLDKVSCFKKRYVDNPECLRKPTLENICNTIKFWKKIMPSCKNMNFESMMDALNTCSWRGYKNSGRTWAAADLKIRNDYYCDLLKLYKK